MWVTQHGRQVDRSGRQVLCSKLYGGARCGSPSRVYSLEVESTGVQVGSTGFGVVIYMLPHDVAHPGRSTGLQVGFAGFDLIFYMRGHDVAYPAGSTGLHVGSTGLQSGLTGIQAATLTFRGARKRVSKQSQSAPRKQHISRRQLTLPPV